MREHKSWWVGARIAALTAAIAIAGGCNDQGDSSGVATASGNSNFATTPNSTVGPATLAKHSGSLAISGSPASTLLVGYPYSFQPVVTHLAGARVTFTIQNKPAWATFNAVTGELSGVPTAAEAGQYAQIIIVASDGASSATLAPFSVTVADDAAGSVTVSWTPPTTNSDGSAITNLAGYQISYGQNPAALNQTVAVNTVGLTNYVIDDLTPGIWYFAIQAVNSSGTTSAASAVVSTNISEVVNHPARY